MSKLSFIEKNVLKKIVKYKSPYIEPFNPFFFERKKLFLSKEGQLKYKLRAIHSEGAFLRDKRNTRIPTIQKKRTKKSRNRFNTMKP